jgi:hypothetical protein
MLGLVHDGSESAVPGGPAAGSSLLDEIVRDGARRMFAAALQTEVTAYVDQFVDEVDENGSPTGGPQRLPRAQGGGHRGRCGAGPPAAVDDTPGPPEDVRRPSARLIRRDGADSSLSTVR